jgi:hypothetical protein
MDYLNTQGCSVPDCVRTAAEEDLCFEHQMEMEQAMKENDLDRAMDELQDFGKHPRSAETYYETKF